MATHPTSAEQVSEKALRERTIDPRTEHAFATIGADLSTGLTLEWQVDGIRHAKGKGIAVDEEVLQTFLWVHAKELTGEPVTIFAKSGYYWGMADLLGIDALGRIHVFELKKTTVGADVAAQLEQYLLGYVLQDVSLLTQEWRARQAQLLGDGREGLLVSLAGAHAGVRTDTKGRKAIAKSLARENPEAAREIKRLGVFRKLPPDEKARLLAETLLKLACRKRKLTPESCPTLAELGRQAEQLRPRLDATATLDLPYPRVRSRAVVWIVGPRVDESARERIRLWRRAGLDARWLELRVVALTRQLGWNLAAAREHAPHRTAVTRQTVDWLQSHPDRVKDSTLSARFYRECAPSLLHRNTKDQDSGRLLQQCCIVVQTPGWPEVQFRQDAPTPTNDQTPVTC